MGSFSGLGIALSFVFGFILLAVVAEIYYLLWWKKKRVSHNETDDDCTESKELAQLFCWKKPSSLQTESSDDDEGELWLELGLGLGPREEGVEAELIRAHNLCGPPRFLFTIKEETHEDLESDDGKSRRVSRATSLSDLNLILSPLASPLSKSPTSGLDPCNNFNPLFESSAELDFNNRLVSSPPPKFKFLRDAEEKLRRKLKEEALSHTKMAEPKSLGTFKEFKVANGSSMNMVEGSFLKFIKSREPLLYLPQYPSSCALVRPLESSTPGKHESNH